MKSAVFTVFKKELKRFFNDRRMLISTILLPGIMIFVMYSFMGSAMTDLIGNEEAVYNICAVNIPSSVKVIFESAGLQVNVIDAQTLETVKSDIENDSGSYDACVVFPENFESGILTYDISGGEAAPQISVFYNSVSTDSSVAFSMITGMLDSFEDSMNNKFDVNMGSEMYDLAKEEDMTGMLFSMLMPMLLLIFLYSGCMAVAVESIAGEKERGTIATLLVTPAKRSHIAMGKIAALSIIALLSGASSALGTFTSLPKLMGDTGMINGSFYTFKDYVLLAVVILSTVLVLITLISVISAFAKSVKEAQTYVMPVMIIVMAVGISGMFGSAKTEPFFYLIPLYNSVQSMVGIFSFDINYTNIVITAIVNLVFAGLGVFVLTKLFNSEKVMFSK